MQDWNYKTENIAEPLSEKELNELGNDGWELVGFQVKDLPTRVGYFYIFKRPDDYDDGDGD